MTKRKVKAPIEKPTLQTRQHKQSKHPAPKSTPKQSQQNQSNDATTSSNRMTKRKVISQDDTANTTIQGVKANSPPTQSTPTPTRRTRHSIPAITGNSQLQSYGKTKRQCEKIHNSAANIHGNTYTPTKQPRQHKPPTTRTTRDSKPGFKPNKQLHTPKQSQPTNAAKHSRPAIK